MGPLAQISHGPQLLPFLNPLCSSPTCPSLFSITRSIKILPYTFPGIDNRLVPLLFLHSSRSPFPLYRGTMHPIFHSLGILPLLKHTYNNLTIHSAHTYPPLFRYSAFTSSKPYHTIPYHTIPYHTIPYHTIPYHT